MLKKVWVAGLCLLLTCVAASAAKVEMKADTTEWQTQYFDASEVTTDVYVKMTADGQNSDIPTIYQFKVAPDWGDGPGTMCVKIVELKTLDKAMFSSTRTAHYVHQLVNISKITKVTTFKNSDYAQFGLSEQDQFWLSYVTLTTGEKLTAIAPQNYSGYVTCGMKNGEVKVNSKFSQTVQRQTILKDSCAGYTEPKDQIMASLSLDTSFNTGGELKIILEDCAAKAADLKQRQEAEARKKAQARIDEDALFEQQKAKHKMRPGVELLGDLGANQAKRLVNNCFETPNFLQPDRGESSMSKEQWRRSRCGGYYKEEVEDLLRELRIRGIVSN